MELMVTSKPTTEGRGASSPVTKTWPDCNCPGGVEFEELEPQPTSVRVASRAATVRAKNRFMTSSGCKSFLGEQSICRTDMETRLLPECRVTFLMLLLRVRLRGPHSNGLAF